MKFNLQLLQEISKQIKGKYGLNFGLSDLENTNNYLYGIVFSFESLGVGDDDRYAVAGRDCFFKYDLVNLSIESITFREYPMRKEPIIEDDDALYNNVIKSIKERLYINQEDFGRIIYQINKNLKKSELGDEEYDVSRNYIKYYVNNKLLIEEFKVIYKSLGGRFVEETDFGFILDRNIRTLERREVTLEDIEKDIGETGSITNKNLRKLFELIRLKIGADFYLSECLDDFIGIEVLNKECFEKLVVVFTRIGAVFNHKLDGYLQIKRTVRFPTSAHL